MLVIASAHRSGRVLEERDESGFMLFSELIKHIGGGVTVMESRLASDPSINRVCEDSRKVQRGDLFVARSGTKTSGAQFAADALSKGAAAIISAEALDLPASVPFARVDNANRALALLAHEIAGHPTASMKMLAVTGTKGKTTVAYLLRSVLKAAGHKVGMIGTVEIDDGKFAVPADMTTPGSVDLVDLFSRMKANGVTHCIMEVSSHALHQDRVAGIDFAVAIFTNLTGDHLDYHKTMEEYAAAKALLFNSLDAGATAIINIDDRYASAMTKQCRADIVPIHVEPLPAPSDKRLFSPQPPANGWTALVSGLASDSMHVHVRSDYPHETGVFEFNSPMIGCHNAYNLLCVIAAASALGIRVYDALDALENDTGAPGRLQPVIAPGQERSAMPFQVFVDYAHTHDALENVLTTLRTTMSNCFTRFQPNNGRLICLFGCGGDRDRTKRPKMAKVAETLADFVILTSDNPRTENPLAIIEEICTGFSPSWKTARKITVEPDRRLAIQKAIALAQPGDVVLLAGKGHENYQIIGTTKHHFDDVEEAQNALRELNMIHQDARQK